MPGTNSHDRGSIRARLLAVVAELNAVRDGSLRFPLVVEVRDESGGSVSFRAESPADLQLDPLANLNAYEKAVVGACTSEPAARKALAKRAGKRFNRWFHEAVRGLVEAGILREDHRGVWRP